MKYDSILAGRFISRPNRFIAYVEIEGKTQICHVKNTGRCKELLIPGTEVYVQDHGVNLHRKTRYSLISVRKGELLINMDSQAPNQAFHEWLCTENNPLFGMAHIIKPECRFEDSRFDFYLETEEQKAFIEVKGVTLEQDGIAMFPDAPTERGIKHLDALCRCVQQGYRAYAAFVIQMKPVNYFTPNDQTHSAFGEALRQAKAQGVEIFAVDCLVTKNEMQIQGFIPVRLDQ